MVFCCYCLVSKLLPELKSYSKSVLPSVAISPYYKDSQWLPNKFNAKIGFLCTSTPAVFDIFKLYKNLTTHQIGHFGKSDQIQIRNSPWQNQIRKDFHKRSCQSRNVDNLICPGRWWYLIVGWFSCDSLVTDWDEGRGLSWPVPVSPRLTTVTSKQCDWSTTAIHRYWATVIRSSALFKPLHTTSKIVLINSFQKKFHSNFNFN